jgi:Family of unknown function (DUF6345)
LLRLARPIGRQRRWPNQKGAAVSIRLPVYELSRPDVHPEKLDEILEHVFDARRPAREEVDGHIRATSGDISASVDAVAGSIFAADTRHQWREAKTKPELLSEGEAYRRARDVLQRLELMPQFDEQAPFAVTELGAGRTILATTASGTRETHTLDVQARYAIGVRNQGVAGAPSLLPIVGGGGKFKVAYGDGGRPIGYSGSWRKAGDSELVEALDEREARERFDGLVSHLDVSGIHGFLAYYSAPAGSAQEMLTPVWVFGGTLRVRGHAVPMRLVTIPATEHGPNLPTYTPQPPRQKQAGRLDLATSRRGDVTAHSVNPFEAGTSWIGTSGGLAGSHDNAEGFVDGLAADGWLVNFNWGDANAWESDWHRNDDTWVDAADFVFYTGHASKDGWVLSSPDDGFLSFNEVGAGPETPGDLWGQQDLEWIIIAACGPLQDDVISAGGGDVLGRWDGAFDGLHSLMGYGAITFDNTDEGRKVVEYAKQGTPVIDAWFRAAQEIQPATNGASPPDGPDVWVGAMYVVAGSADPRNDHLWGHGFVSADPHNPNTLVCMWTTC